MLATNLVARMVVALLVRPASAAEEVYTLWGNPQAGRQIFVNRSCLVIRAVGVKGAPELGRPTGRLAAEEQQRIVQERYATGRGIQLEILDAAQVTLTRARFNVVSALADYQSAAAMWLKALGRVR